MTAVLARQLDAYEQSARSAAAAGPSVEDVVELLDVGIKLNEAADETALRWHTTVAAGRRAFDAGEAAGFTSLYRRLDEWFDLMAPLVDAVRRRGEEVPAAERFTGVRTALKGVLGIDPNRVAASLQHLAEGKRKPMAEVRDGLRHRLVTGWGHSRSAMP